MININEKWKNLYGWEDFYEVSTEGNIRSKVRTGVTKYGERKYGGNLVKPLKKSNGYLVVNLTCKQRREQVLVHRAVLLSFFGNAGGLLQCCHNNGNKEDNRVDNLRWGTALENAQDKIKHGTILKGELIGNSLLKEADVKKIISSDLSQRRLAEKYKVSRSCIRHILKKESWRYLHD